MSKRVSNKKGGGGARCAVKKSKHTAKYRNKRALRRLTK